MSITGTGVQEMDQAATLGSQVFAAKPKVLTPEEIRALLPPKRKITEAEWREMDEVHARSMKSFADAGWTEERLLQLHERLQEEDRKAKWID